MKKPKDYKGDGILRRPDVDYQLLSEVFPAKDAVPYSVAEQVETQIKYSGYVGRQEVEIARQKRLENVALPELMDYRAVKGLSSEVVEKLNEHQPVTIGAASRIPGVTPAAISILLVHLKKQTMLSEAG